MFLIGKEMIMVGNMQRKIVGLLLCVFLVPSFAQAMIIIPDNVDKGIAAVFGGAVSVGAMALLPRRDYVLGSTAGSLSGAALYFALREYTPAQIEVRAQQTDDEIKTSRVGKLLSDSSYINIGNINGVSSSGWPCIDALEDTGKYELRLNKHIEWLKKVQKAKKYDDEPVSVLYENNNDKEDETIASIIKRFEQYKKNIVIIRSVINDPDNVSYQQQLKRLEKATNTKIKIDTLEDEKNKTKASVTAANAKWYAVGLKFGLQYWKWIVFLGVAGPGLLATFAWSSKIPLPY
jgi:hypothetical protein